MKIAVVVPYFQRKPGLLMAAVGSIFRQQEITPLQVIVVDDGSPLPAENELRRLEPEARNRVVVVSQPNQGVAAARNAGLDRVAHSADWIAFLDADDVWRENHLCTAITALERGYDLFFTNSYRDGETTTLFEAAGMSLADHKPIDETRALYEFGLDLFKTVLSFSPLITSSVVYRRAGYADLRFRETYRTYEDSLFWLHFHKARVVFCAETQTILGRGVNISRRPDEWASNRSLEIMRDIDGMYRLIPREMELTSEQQSFVQRLQRRNRKFVASAVVSMLRRGVGIEYPVVKEVMGGRLALLYECLGVVSSELTARAVVRPWRRTFNTLTSEKPDHA